MLKTLLDILQSHTSPTAWKWFNHVLPDLFKTPGSFAAAYAGVHRRLGNREIDFHSDDTEFFPFDPQFMTFFPSTLAEVGRMCLLLHASTCLPPDEFDFLIEETYHHGDSLERQALLRSLQILPHPDSYLSTAIEACRTHVTTVFEAIACQNAYPCKYFPEENFNQLVVKALFIGTPLQTILGLQQRRTPRLEQMVRDFSTERILAGRTVPDDITLIVPR